MIGWVWSTGFRVVSIPVCVAFSSGWSEVTDITDRQPTPSKTKTRKIIGHDDSI